MTTKLNPKETLARSEKDLLENMRDLVTGPTWQEFETRHELGRLVSCLQAKKGLLLHGCDGIQDFHREISDYLGVSEKLVIECVAVAMMFSPQDLASLANDGGRHFHWDHLVLLVPVHPKHWGGLVRQVVDQRLSPQELHHLVA